MAAVRVICTGNVMNVPEIKALKQLLGNILPERSSPQ